MSNLTDLLRGSTTIKYKRYSVDSTLNQTVFSGLPKFEAGHIVVFIDGVRQINTGGTTSYTEQPPNQITLTTPLPAGIQVETISVDDLGSSYAPQPDNNPIVHGSEDITKLVRLEADGLTTDVTRVLTVQDKDYTLAGTDDITADISTHSGLDTGVHGVGASTIASAADIATHEALTTGAHGVSSGNIASTEDIVANNIVVQSEYVEDNTQTTWGIDAQNNIPGTTVPQTSAGRNIAALDLTITPTNAANYIEVTVVMNAHGDSSADRPTVAVFNTDYHATNAMVASQQEGFQLGMQQITVRRRILASALNGTNPTTFTVNIGHPSNNAMAYNRSVSQAYFGSAVYSSIKVQEIKA